MASGNADFTETDVGYAEEAIEETVVYVNSFFVEQLYQMTES